MKNWSPQYWFENNLSNNIISHTKILIRITPFSFQKYGVTTTIVAKKSVTSVLKHAWFIFYPYPGLTFFNLFIYRAIIKISWCDISRPNQNMGHTSYSNKFNPHKS